MGKGRRRWSQLSDGVIAFLSSIEPKATELMWGVGADRFEIVQALRWAADKMDNYREEDQI